MPEIDAFLGLSFCLYFFDNKQHKLPHLHVKYGSYELIIAIETGENLEGYLPNKQRKRAEDYIAQHKPQLMLMWQKAVRGENPGKLGDMGGVC
ncbi:hypothetical protein Rhein_2593 [Rheinheimera sp. A13L]|uniref:type II toxin-antitoxin system toxin DhiT n=1 Tax=Rheinheimera sp. A13L TaxID=506534 RepID=UPI0002125627|nr:DUF4160 domain-containing protein [Rheinheimera sp. A13L]EGM77311.1 hypothetical protein Rhein_2593 [Rheinheimera sp. A13L]